MSMLVIPDCNSFDIVTIRDAIKHIIYIFSLSKNLHRRQLIWDARVHMNVFLFILLIGLNL